MHTDTQIRTDKPKQTHVQTDTQRNTQSHTDAETHACRYTDTPHTPTRWDMMLKTGPKHVGASKLALRVVGGSLGRATSHHPRLQLRLGGGLGSRPSTVPGIITQSMPHVALAQPPSYMAQMSEDWRELGVWGV